MTTPTWDYIRSLPRQPASLDTVRSAPPGPGVYAWFRDGEIVYLGKASKLRGRLVTHRRTSTRPGKSTLRATVGELTTGVPRATLRINGRYVPDEAAAIDAWLDACELSWVETETNERALDLERALLTVWRPPLNRA